MKKSILREIFSWIFYFIILFGAIFLFVKFIGERTTVQGDSMQPALYNNESVIIDKISYVFVSPKRYDIVVFPFKYEDDADYIKRIVALPGETVQIQNGSIYINGTTLRDDFSAEAIQKAGIAQDAITLARDEYFVLGDNRNNSRDSRDPFIGCIKRDDIIGKAFLRIWPLSKFGLIN